MYAHDYSDSGKITPYIGSSVLKCCLGNRLLYPLQWDSTYWHGKLKQTCKTTILPGRDVTMATMFIFPDWVGHIRLQCACQHWRGGSRTPVLTSDCLGAPVPDCLLPRREKRWLIQPTALQIGQWPPWIPRTQVAKGTSHWTQFLWPSQSMSQLSYKLYLIPHTASLSHTFSNHQVTEGMVRTELTNKLTIRTAALLASRYSSLGEPVCSSLGPTGRWKLLNIRVNICKETSEIIIHIAIVCDQQSHGSIYSVAGNFRRRKLSIGESLLWKCIAETIY